MLQPILDRVLVRRLAEAQPDSLIAIPEQYRQASRRCVVEALGNFVVIGGIRAPLSDFLAVGDIVHVGEYNAETVEVDGEALLLVRIQDIRGKER